MSEYRCIHCNEYVSDSRWRKGKKWCVDCGITKGLRYNAEISTIASAYREQVRRGTPA